MGLYTSYVVTAAGWGKSRFTVVCMENNTITNNNARINSVFHIPTTANLLLPQAVYVLSLFQNVLFLFLKSLVYNSMPCYAGSSLMNLTSTASLGAAFSLLLDLILCCFVNLMQPKCTVCVKPMVVGSHDLAFTLTHHSLPDSPKPTSSPASSTHSKHPIQVHHFYLLYHIFALLFL